MTVVEFPVTVEADSPFPIENIPFGIFTSTEDGSRRVGVAIGKHVLDLAQLETRGCFNSISSAFGDVFAQVGLPKSSRLRQVSNISKANLEHICCSASEN